MAIVPRAVSTEALSGSSGVSVSPADLVEAPPGLEPLALAFVEDVRDDTRLRLRVRGSASQDRASAPARIVLELARSLGSGLPEPSGVSPAAASGPIDESYRLTIADRITVQATTSFGIAAGLSSLRQLIGGVPPTADGTRPLAACVIEDAPRYAWRSLKLDVARFWYPVADIKRVISQLSRYKMNALQLHLVDNEGWRIEIAGYPKVAEGSAQRYTQHDLAELVGYARDRGIVIIPEIDLPGHCAALLKAHPEFGVMQHVEGHDIAYVDPSRPELWGFLRAVYTQMLEVTGSRYLHLGCDEAFRMPGELFTDFVHRASALVRELGAEPIAFQEASRAGLKTGSLVQFWVDFAAPGGLIDDLEARAARGEELPFGMAPAAFPFYREGYADLGRAEEQRLGVILSPTQHAYFDTPFAEPSSDSTQESGRATLGMPVYAPQPLDAFGDWDPEAAFDGLNPELIAGVEAALWSDAVQEASTMQLLLLPRLPGFAERAWSRNPRHWQEFRAALAKQAPSWRAQRLRFFESSLVDWE